MATHFSEDASAVSSGRAGPCESGSAGLPARELSGRSPLATLTGVRILGTGSYVPEQVVCNEDLAALGCDAEWILQRTGIRERRKAAPNEATSDLAHQAALRCLENAQVSADEVDLILVATMTPDMLTPSTACIVQHRLGTVAPAMDLNAACSGFLYALVTGMQFVKSGCNRRVLVIGSDVMSRIINPDDKRTYPLFGDGAGAVLLGPSDEGHGFLSYTLGSEGDMGCLLSIPGGGSREPLTADGLVRGRQYLQMDGRAVFKWAVRLINDTIRDVVQHAGLSVADLNLVVLHQANARIIDAASDNLGIERERVIVNLDRFGNTTAATVPIALDEAVQTGRLQPGQRALLMGFGAGLTWGAGVLGY